ncbi:MAG: insulinase family protein [Clostridia bacterium]|nr:insulinase family protein [Clostridia bacterium]
MTLRQLSCGIRVALEPMPHLHSISLGVWVNAGSVFENGTTSGVSHFIEHMVFKGTERRSATDIAMEMDAIGANLNAFTAKECTCFHVKALDEDMPLCVDILSDLVLHNTLDPEELAREKGVVLEEIAMTQDSPEDLVFDKASEAFFAGTALEREILGTEDTVSAMFSDDLRAYMHTHYTAENIVIAAAGKFDEAALLGELEARFACAPHGERRQVPVHETQTGLSVSLTEKDVEQINTVLMFPGAPLASKESFALSVLSNILGGSMSSRLFQKLREQRGLCYSVYSYPMTYRGAGALCLYVGSTAKQAKEALRLMLKELDDLLANGVTEDEFARCKQQLKGSYVLGMESASAHMNAIGKSALLMGEEYDMEKTLRRIEAVSIEDVNAMIPKVFAAPHMTLASVGRLGKGEKALGRALETQVRDWYAKHGA